MSRVVTDVQAIITARFVGGSPVMSEREAYAQVEDTIVSMRPDFECEVAYETVARCEHCNRVWTEDSATYNGGCCDADEAAGPERSPAPSALPEGDR